MDLEKIEYTCGENTCGENCPLRDLGRFHGFAPSTCLNFSLPSDQTTAKVVMRHPGRKVKSILELFVDAVRGGE
jgi:hypothetical protein